MKFPHSDTYEPGATTPDHCPQERLFRLFTELLSLASIKRNSPFRNTSMKNKAVKKLIFGVEV